MRKYSFIDMVWLVSLYRVFIICPEMQTILFKRGVGLDGQQLFIFLLCIPPYVVPHQGSVRTRIITVLAIPVTSILVFLHFGVDHGIQI